MGVTAAAIDPRKAALFNEVLAKVQPGAEPVPVEPVSVEPVSVEPAVEAKPKAKEGAFQAVRVGFRGKDLAALEIIDSFGQKSLLQFKSFAANAVIPAETFRFAAQAGADVIEQ